MGRFVKGEVVVLPFPFSNLRGRTVRPALVVANLPGDDMILCMITRTVRDPDSIPLGNADFAQGNLPLASNIRPNRLFTGEDGIVQGSRGHLTEAKMAEVTRKLIEILNR
jgi:mRNA interferase MazF